MIIICFLKNIKENFMNISKKGQKQERIPKKSFFSRSKQLTKDLQGIAFPFGREISFQGNENTV